jgi:hypothetical protein
MIIYGVDGRLDRLARFYANNNGNMDCFYEVLRQRTGH